MKLMLFDFECPSHGLFEELVNSDVRQIPCTHCGRTSVRQISAVRIDKTAMALSASASPESIAHFERIHRERRAIEDRHHANHGDYGPAPGSDGGRGYDVAGELTYRDPVE